jgi:hypothetical protein
MPFVFMGLGALSIVRGVFRPHRAVLKEGTVKRCAGQNQFMVCDPTDLITAPSGVSAYATAPAKVVAVGENFVHLAVTNEPVFLMYEGIDPLVVEGQYVGRGQEIGKTQGPVAFGVWQLAPSATGPVMQVVPPAAWLAARGMRHVVKNTGPGNQWCEGGRTIHVPADAKQVCGFRQPDPAQFALLPVQINMG